MAAPLRLAAAELAARPWKNGGGVTREIAAHPPGASLAGFEWRVSIAEVASDGPFSRFEGVDRCIALLEGDGMQLRSPDGSVDKRLDQPLAPFFFDGGAAIDATLIDGPTTDFNVMTRRERWQAKVRACHGRHDIIAAPVTLLCCWRGHARIEETGAAHSLSAGDIVLWPTGAPPMQLEATPGAQVLLVQIAPL